MFTNPPPNILRSKEKMALWNELAEHVPADRQLSQLLHKFELIVGMMADFRTGYLKASGVIQLCALMDELGLKGPEVEQ